MNPKQFENQLLPLLLKGAGLVLVGILALLGLIGLVLSVIPGILFLFSRHCYRQRFPVASTRC
ncbi:MAG: hypothetical protein P8N94_08150 [Gammaproteobacteria bacterium]|nr:hypothetical protein [Gammaproteobacteria bacterium]MDG2337945.1 hypothetical protein [Gammaproteobacteria bacterium]